MNDPPTSGFSVCATRVKPDGHADAMPGKHERARPVRAWYLDDELWIGDERTAWHVEPLPEQSLPDAVEAVLELAGSSLEYVSFTEPLDAFRFQKMMIR